jgi:predicted exporter/predicted hotdog family 3-hydroxylacyl-ACP dehydratase
MSRTPRALLLLGLWIAALALLGWFVQRELVLGTDLRLFLPSPTTPEQRLLLEEIGEGPASRVLVIALEGAPPHELADVSRALADELRSSERFRFVTNGETSPDALPESLLAYRFLFSPTLDAQTFDADYLRRQIEARARDLASPAGALLEPWLPRDPTLELLNVLERWRPIEEPRREFDVWFDAAGRRALLLAETQAAAFDPNQQRAALSELDATFARLNSKSPLRMLVSGSGKFTVMMEERTRGDAERLGAIATVGMIVLLWIAYRRPGAVILSALPLASAGLAGLAAVSALFGAVHGITLAFGFTLIGVAQDSPIHLLSHRRADCGPVEVARGIWPTLATGVASTCIAYLTFLLSGVVGLQQLACFTVVGLAVAGLTTRFLLPPLMDVSGAEYSRATFLQQTWRAFERVPRPRALAAALVALCAVLLAVDQTPFWENDLAKLTPVPADLLKQDEELRKELGAPDVRFLLVVDAPDQQQALTRLETLDASLIQLIEDGAISGYDHAARYVPSTQTQRRRQQRLPDGASLRAALQAALTGSPFRAEAFAPFLRDVELARTLPPLMIDELRDTPLHARLDMLLNEHDQRTTALVTFSGVASPDALRRLAAGAGATMLDLKAASESLVAEQRGRMLWSLAAAAVLLIAVVSFALRDRGRVARVIAPMALTTVIILAVLQAAGVALTLFHLIALILAAGLGLDYALFFEHGADDPFEQRRTLHAILVCSMSTLMVFALLATSGLPVLRAIGATVSIGVVSNFVLALLMTQKRPTGVRQLATGQGGGGSQPLSGQSPEARSQRPISALIPHKGAMCLLERVVEWDDERIVLEADTHRSTSNPLRRNNRLRAVHLCEYGAQAMAVHGALKSRQARQHAAPGMLVSLRAVKFTCDYIDALPGSLRVEAHCLQASESSLQYGFRVTHAGALLAEGRAVVVLKEEEPRRTAKKSRPDTLD